MCSALSTILNSLLGHQKLYASEIEQKDVHRIIVGII